jgi:hypothetical protein
MTVATGYCVDAMILRSDTITVWLFSLVTLSLTAHVLGPRVGCARHIRVCAIKRYQL